MGKGMVIAGLMLWAGASAAGSTQANYFELHFVQSEFGGAGDGRTSNGGLGFSFAKSFWEHAAWYGEIDWRHDDDAPELDLVTGSLGAGPRYAVEALGGLSLQLAVSFEHMRIRLQDDDPATAMSEVTTIRHNGVGGSLGLSWPVGDRSELFGRYTLVDLTDTDTDEEDESIILAGFRLGVSDEFSLVASVRDYDNLDTTDYRLGLVVDF